VPRKFFTIRVGFGKYYRRVNVQHILLHPSLTFSELRHIAFILDSTIDVTNPPAKQRTSKSKRGGRGEHPTKIPQVKIKRLNTPSPQSNQQSPNGGWTHCDKLPPSTTDSKAASQPSTIPIHTAAAILVIKITVFIYI